MITIYVHHHYTYEIFWYLFHAVELNEPPPTWFTVNRYNQNKLVKDEVIVPFSYKGVKFEAVFCGNKNWSKKDGYHVFEYNLYHLQKNNISDRGWNLILGSDLESDIIPMLNRYASKLGDKISCFFIDWESSDKKQTESIHNSFNPLITFFKDELTSVKENERVSFTHVLWSFLFPNTINLRDYYFFSDYLKYKNDYKYKVNYPIRRLTYIKKLLIGEIMSKDNPHMNCTISSFSDYFKHSRIEEIQENWYDEVVSKIPEENLINKRGYNIEDWGGEWNDDNMKEFMYKLMTISDVNLIHEVSHGWSINEKSFMHILAEKPFIPTHDGTFSFYDEILKSYGFEVSEFPIKGHAWEKVAKLDSLTRDDVKWNEFVDKIKIYISNLKKNLFEIMNTNNGYLDYLLNKESETKSVL